MCNNIADREALTLVLRPNHVNRWESRASGGPSPDIETRTGTRWSAAMARSAERFPCRSIQIQRKYEAKFDKGLLRIKLPKPADTLPLVRSNWSKPGAL